MRAIPALTFAMLATLMLVQLHGASDPVAQEQRIGKTSFPRSSPYAAPWLWFQAGERWRRYPRAATLPWAPTYALNEGEGRMLLTLNLTRDRQETLQRQEIVGMHAHQYPFGEEPYAAVNVLGGELDDVAPFGFAE